MRNKAEVLIERQELDPNRSHVEAYQLSIDRKPKKYGPKIWRETCRLVIDGVSKREKTIFASCDEGTRALDLVAEFSQYLLNINANLSSLEIPDEETYCNLDKKEALEYLRLAYLYGEINRRFTSKVLMN